MKVKGKSRRHRAGKLGILCFGLVLATAVAVSGYWAYQEGEIAEKQQQTDKIIKQANARLAAIEAKKKEPVYITLPGAEKFQVPAENYEEPNNIWTLVSKARAIGVEYVPSELVTPSVSSHPGTVASEKKVRKIIDEPLTQLFAAAQKEGHSLMIGSAYRSAAYQEQLFATYVSRVGYEQADKYSAHPGFSEHQTGLAVDLSTTSQQCYLSECFIGTADGQWLAENAYKFGFNLRYPKGKEAITGYNFEPWHYRYVGVALATALHESGLTLDEAWPYMETALQTLRSNRAVQ
ncbi:MAG: putative D-alanyl-D-alanine carboxypeptidase [Candidatus Saccharibacteria bacterium]|nr:putative D-alanyl-D-alanine carboxypeptidase [Candidatus Saccharibacteria bacterium]